MMGRRFRSALTDWEAADRDPEYLVRGNRLAVFDDWSVASSLSESEREFHDACTAAESAVWRSRRRRRRTIVALLVTVAVVTSTLGVVAVVQARRAEQQAQVAKARELTSAAVAALDTDPELAGLLALAAADTAEPTVDTISVLRRATSANRLSARHAWPDSIDHMVGIALSSDGTLAAYAGPLVRDPDIDRLEVRDVATWSVLWSIETRSYGVDGIWFSPDSTKLVTGLSTWTDEDVPRGVRVYRHAVGRDRGDAWARPVWGDGQRRDINHSDRASVATCRRLVHVGRRRGRSTEFARAGRSGRRRSDPDRA